MNGWKTIISSVVALVFTAAAMKGVDLAHIFGVDSDGVATFIAAAVSNIAAIVARYRATKNLRGGDLK